MIWDLVSSKKEEDLRSSKQASYPWEDKGNSWDDTKEKSRVVVYGSLNQPRLKENEILWEVGLQGEKSQEGSVKSWHDKIDKILY